MTLHGRYVCYLLALLLTQHNGYVASLGWFQIPEHGGLTLGLIACVRVYFDWMFPFVERFVSIHRWYLLLVYSARDPFRRSRTQDTRLPRTLIQYGCCN